MKYRAIIVDDLPLAIASLKYELTEHFKDRIEIVETAEGVIDAAKKIKTTEPDLIFLDIHMEDGDGFDLLDIIHNKNVQVIFTTASSEHALKAFKYAACDYLLKPIDREQLDRAISKLHTIEQDSDPNSSSYSKRIALSTSEAVQLVDYDQILSLEASGNYTQFCLLDGSKILMSRTLKDFEKQLDERFLRVHQSHLINVHHVKAYIKTEGGYIEMCDGRRVPVSVRKKAEVVERLKNN
jgi:two-component system LytT family response regulator